MISPSLYRKPSIKNNRIIVSYNKYDTCKNLLITDCKFRCTGTGKTYFIKDNLSCDSCNVIYLITCSNCRERYESTDYWKCRLLNRYLQTISLVLRIYYGNEENIARHNYLLTCMGWITLMICIVWKGKAIKNNCFWTDV